MSAGGDTTLVPVLNSGATIVPYEHGGTICFTVDAPVPGKGLRRTRVTPTERPSMHRFLTSAALAPSAGSISVAAEDIGDLCAAALLVDPAVAPERLEFRTSLQAPEAVTDAPRALQGNPRVRLASADTAAPSAPEAWARVPRADSPFVAWVEDPVRDLVFCFWLTRDEAETVRGLDEGSRSPAKAARR